MIPTEIGRVNEAFRRRYGGVGSSGPIETLATDLFPMVQLSDSLMDPELHFLVGSRLVAQFRTQLGAAGVRSRIDLANPAGSGILAIILGWTWHIENGGGLTVETFKPASVAAGFKGDPLDMRAAPLGGNTEFGSCILSGTTGPLAGALRVFTLRSIDNATRDPASLPPVILEPDSQLSWTVFEADKDLTVSVWWRERVLTKWERP